MKQPLSIVILGCGALASLFAAMLTRYRHRNVASYNVCMFGHWPEHLARIRTDGLWLKTENTKECIAVEVESSADQLPFADIALVLVKSWQTRAIAGIIRDTLADHGRCLTLQNGLGNDELLRKLVSADSVWHGVTALGANIIEPGSVNHAGDGTTMVNIEHGQLEEQQQLIDILNGAGLKAELSVSASGLVWLKLAVNAAINPMTALLEVRNGALLENPSWRQVMIAATLEVIKVAQITGITIPHKNPADFVCEVCNTTSQNYASMLQDIRRGAETEIESISGSVIRIAEANGVEVPVNRFLYDAVRDKIVGNEFDPDRLNRLAEVAK